MSYPSIHSHGTEYISVRLLRDDSLANQQQSRHQVPRMH